MDRQPSAPSTISSETATISGLTTTYRLGSGGSASSGAPSGVSAYSMTAMRWPTATWGAARPTPGAARMVAIMSSINSWIWAVLGSSTARALRRSTGLLGPIMGLTAILILHVLYVYRSHNFIMGCRQVAALPWGAARRPGGAGAGRWPAARAPGWSLPASS